LNDVRSTPSLSSCKNNLRVIFGEYIFFSTRCPSKSTWFAVAQISSKIETLNNAKNGRKNKWRDKCLLMSWHSHFVNCKKKIFNFLKFAFCIICNAKLEYFIQKYSKCYFSTNILNNTHLQMYYKYQKLDFNPFHINYRYIMINSILLPSPLLPFFSLTLLFQNSWFKPNLIITFNRSSARRAFQLTFELLCGFWVSR